MEAKVFVKIDEYKDVLDTVGLIKDKLSDAKDILARVTEMKTKEDQELAQWHEKVAEVEKKMETIDSELFKPEPM
jgi:hypothetical protein